MELFPHDKPGFSLSSHRRIYEMSNALHQELPAESYLTTLLLFKHQILVSLLPNDFLVIGL